MGEEPHGVARIEAVALHDLHAVAFDAFEENELMHTHLANDARKEREWEFDHGMESDEPADARIHLFDGNGSVSAAEGVDPAASLDGIGHDLGGLANAVEL